MALWGGRLCGAKLRLQVRGAPREPRGWLMVEEDSLLQMGDLEGTGWAFLQGP